MAKFFLFLYLCLFKIFSSTPLCVHFYLQTAPEDLEKDISGSCGCERQQSVYQNPNTILISCNIQRWDEELLQRSSKPDKIPSDATKTVA